MIKLTQHLLSLLLLLFLILCFKQPVLAADINLVIDSNGKITDQYDSKVIGELYRGWRENVLFASLSQESALRYNFTVSVIGNEVDLVKINPTLYAVHGAIANEISSDAQEKVWEVTASPGSQITLVAQVPYGIFNDSFFWKMMAILAMLPDKIWLILSILIPIIVFILFLAKQRANRGTRTKNSIIHPEILDVSPTALTVLVKGFVSKRASAATLVDLAQRGHVQMLIRNTKIILYKKVGRDKLREHEKAILERWFKTDWNSRGEDLNLEIKTQVINERSKIANMLIYKEINTYSWFKTSPLITHWKILISSFFATIIVSVFFFSIFILLPSANPLLWFSTSLLFSIGVIYAWEPSIAILSPKGKEARTMLNETRAALTAPTKIRMAPNDQAAWEHYLAISIVLGVTPEWLYRWSDTPFQQPSWLLTTEPLRDFEDFQRHLAPILSVASESIRDTILPAYV
jgi:hypothetical protein